MFFCRAILSSSDSSLEESFTDQVLATTESAGSITIAWPLFFRSRLKNFLWTVLAHSLPNNILVKLNLQPFFLFFGIVCYCECQFDVLCRLSMLHEFVMLSSLFLKICSSKKNNDLITGRSVFCFCLLPSFPLRNATWALEVALDLLFLSRSHVSQEDRISRYISLVYQASMCDLT